MSKTYYPPQPPVNRGAGDQGREIQICTVARQPLLRLRRPSIIARRAAASTGRRAVFYTSLFSREGNMSPETFVRCRRTATPRVLILNAKHSEAEGGVDPVLRGSVACRCRRRRCFSLSLSLARRRFVPPLLSLPFRRTCYSVRPSTRVISCKSLPTISPSHYGNGRQAAWLAAAANDADPAAAAAFAAERTTNQRWIGNLEVVRGAFSKVSKTDRDRPGLLLLL